MKLIASILNRLLQVLSVIGLIAFSTLTVGIVFGICILIVNSIGSDIRVSPIEVSFAKLYIGTFLCAVWYPLTLLLIIKSIRLLIQLVIWISPWIYYESKDLEEIYQDTKFNSIDFIIRCYRKSFNRTRLLIHWIGSKFDKIPSRISSILYLISKVFNAILAVLMGVTLLDIIVIRSIYASPNLTHLILAILIGCCMLNTSKWIYNNITK